ncbi:MAG: dephospho-CoA kinase [Acidimicrobiia bacterium]|nr:dephospho-CoA kinase [Acidimicrobiia bacterium]
MILVGLTGGIGSGKSVVSAQLAAHGAVVIDADVIVRQLQQPGQVVLQRIVDRLATRSCTSGEPGVAVDVLVATGCCRRRSHREGNGLVALPRGGHASETRVEGGLGVRAGGRSTACHRATRCRNRTR